MQHILAQHRMQYGHVEAKVLATKTVQTIACHFCTIMWR